MTMSRQIKTTCPRCETRFALNAPECEDEFDREVALRLAALTMCPPCAIFATSRDEIQKVERHNQAIIRGQEMALKNLVGKLKNNPRQASILEEQIETVEKTINIARADLVDAVTAIARLDEARTNQIAQTQRQTVEA